jgi:hypothetical protein
MLMTPEMFAITNVLGEWDIEDCCGEAAATKSPPRLLSGVDPLASIVF